MIVRDDGLGVPQTAHSALAGRLAEAWRIDADLPAQELRVAAAIHDLGWAEWEQSPRPVSFMDVETAEHVAIWTRGTDAAATFGRWVGLLVSLHCTRLMGWRHHGGNGGPEVDALGERELDLDPWPLASDAISLTVDARPLDGGPWRTLHFHLAR